MKKLYLFVVLSFLFTNAYSQPAVSTELFATGLDRPVKITSAGDDRLFVVEQEGVIRIVNADGTVNSTPFLDITSKVITIGGIGDERGLLGLTFHPDYATNDYFYVNYINTSGNTVVSRFTVSAGDPDIADTTEQILLTINQPNVNHNGGDMAFSPIDGHLYIGTGDGGGAGDTSNNAQNLNLLLGKMLRVDEDGNIPTGNPFATDGDPNTLPEIWAYGLRNPAKFSFDSLNGELWIADVGQNTKEEINLVLPAEDGLNYGWRCYEGNSTFNTSGCPAMSTLTFPVAEYNYGGSPFKCAITGGYRYRGSTYPGMDGLYFFADYCSGQIGYLEENGPNWDLTWTNVTGGNWSSFGQSNTGELYISDLFTGNIYRVTDANLSITDVEQDTFKVYPNPSASVFNFEFQAELPSEISLYDISGKRISTIQNTQGQIVQISTQNLSKGLYIAEITNNLGQSNYRKLVVK